MLFRGVALIEVKITVLNLFSIVSLKVIVTKFVIHYRFLFVK